jgi:hypothetical protein
MKFVIEEILWSYTTSINGCKINSKYLYVIRLKKSFLQFFKRKKYLRINSCYNDKYLVTLTTDSNHATKYKTEEEASKRLQDMLNNPENYET